MSEFPICKLVLSFALSSVAETKEVDKNTNKVTNNKMTMRRKNTFFFINIHPSFPFI